MEDKFWACVKANVLPDDLLDLFELDETYRQLIIKCCESIAKYFKHDPPNNEKFYQYPGDPYDGISLSPNEIIKFIDGVIMSGRDRFDAFCNDPFEGNIMNYLTRRMSSGNSSRLVLDKYYTYKLSLLIDMALDEDIYDEVFEIIHSN